MLDERKKLILRKMMSQFKLQGILIEIGQRKSKLNFPKQMFLKSYNKF